MNKITTYRAGAVLLGVVMTANSWSGLSVLADEQLNASIETSYEEELVIDIEENDFTEEDSVGEGESEDNGEQTSEEFDQESQEDFSDEEDLAEDEEENSLAEEEDLTEENSKEDDFTEAEEEDLADEELEEELVLEEILRQSVKETSIPVASEGAFRNAINSIESGDSLEIVIESDFSLNSALVISEDDVEIYFVSDDEQVIKQRSENPHIIIDNAKNVTIYFDNVIFDGSGNGGGIYLQNSSEVVIEGAYVTNSSSEQGGALTVDGSSLYLENSVFADNTAKDGGGIAVINEGSLFADSILVQNNNAYATGARSAYGGGVFAGNQSFIEIHNSIISGNDASAAAASSGRYGYGGGIAVDNSSEVVLGNDILIQNNSAMYGGGVYCQDGNPTTLVLSEGVSILNNELTKGGGNGGGVLMGDNTSLEIAGAKIEYNKTAASGNGGGIKAGKNVTITMYDGSVSDNISTWSGAGVYIEHESEFIMHDGHIDRNESTQLGGSGIDGACHVQDGITYKTSTVIINGGSVSNNIAQTSMAGVTAYHVILNGGHIDNNTAGFGYASAVFAHIFELHDGTVNGNVLETAFFDSSYIPGMTISCYEFVMSGGEISNNSYGNKGKNVPVAGTVYINRQTQIDSSVTVTGGTISHNAADQGGAIYFFPQTYASSNRISITGGVFANNAADSYGGALCLGYHYDEFVIGGNASFIGNEAAYGGAVYKEGGSIYIEGEASFIDNQASSYGGAIYTWLPAGGTGPLQVDINGEGVLFKGNRVDVNGGGAIFMNRSGSATMAEDTMTISGEVSFIDNTVAKNGGAIWIWDLNVLDIDENVSFRDNTAGSGWIMTSTADIALHQQQVKTDAFSSGFQYGFNNYDINYTKGTRAVFWNVNYYLNYGENNLYRSASMLNESVLFQPENPVRDGWEFTSWYSDSECLLEWDFENNTVTENISLFAGWVEVEEGDEDGEGNENGGGDEDGEGNENGGGDEDGEGNENSGGDEDGEGNENSGGDEDGEGNENSGGDEDGEGNENGGGDEDGEGNENGGGDEDGEGNENGGGDEDGEGNENNGGNGNGSSGGGSSSSNKSKNSENEELTIILPNEIPGLAISETEFVSPEIESNELLQVIPKTSDTLSWLYVAFSFVSSLGVILFALKSKKKKNI